MITTFDTTDRTLSPYFFVQSESDVEQFPLRSTSVEVNIAGVIADVRVTQIYKNNGRHAIEAVYIFPGSTRAAVYGMKMTIGERLIIAKIEERKAARKQYEQARQEGKSASLLEQQRPNVFQMNVANILPGDEIRVELCYTELLVPTDSVYEFVYPTVVGPRYAGESEKNEQWVQNPYLREGEPPTNTFDITATLAAGMPVQDMVCHTHKTNITFSGPARATATLDDSEKLGGNRDYILRYRLAGGKIESGLLLYEPSDPISAAPGVPAWKQDREKFFLLMVQPPKAVIQEQIPPREYIFIVDTSGSMSGLPIEVSKKLLKSLIEKLRPTDRFNVLLFSDQVSFFSKKSIPATSQNVSQAIRTIEKQFGGGGTRLLKALKKALALPKTGGFSRSVILATDGYVDVEKQCFDYIRNHLGDANFFPFGIGSSSNRYLIEGIAHVGMSEPFMVTDAGEAPAKAEKFCQYVQSPVLTNIRAEFEGFKVYDVEPPAIPDVLAERPVVLFGKWRGEPAGSIRLTGIAADGEYVRTVDVGEIKSFEINSALPYLWARHRIALLADYQKADSGSDMVKEVTQLGLRYNLLTEYTSFIAVDDRVRRENDDLTTVNQPLPLPDGVSEHAVSQKFKKGIINIYRRRSSDSSLPETTDRMQIDDIAAAPVCKSASSSLPEITDKMELGAAGCSSEVESDEFYELDQKLCDSGEYENTKQKIVEELDKRSKSKSTFYLNDLAKIAGTKPREAKKLINQMVEDGVLEYWSSGSTSMYGLKETGSDGKGR